MTFLEIRFPESISFKSSSMLEFNTSIVKTKNGLEQRNINWHNGRMKYNIVNGIKTREELELLITFFRNVRGAGYGFRFKDWSDYSVESQKIGVGDGAKREFQLIKSYSIDDKNYIRKITKPVLSTVNIYINGVKSNEFNMDFTTGTVEFDIAPNENDVIEADFEFDVPVRFNGDSMEITMDTINSGVVKDIVLVEI